MLTSDSSASDDDESNNGEGEREPEHAPGHEQGTRANACSTASIHPDFYRALFMYLAAANTGRSSLLKARLRDMGSLRNGGIFIAASSIRGGGRGLFTGRAFVKDTYVCLFGGSVVWANDARRASEVVKHAREAGNGYLMDGTGMASLFKQATPRWCEMQRRKSPALRQKLFPISTTGHPPSRSSPLPHSPHPPS